MKESFSNYVEDCHRAVVCQRLHWLLEVSQQFPKAEMNDLFDDQLRALMQTAGYEDKERLRRTLGFDWTGYIAKSLRNAGFGNHEIDELVQHTVVKLLVSPGRLFSGWSGQPIDRRFKASVRNAILNLIEKRQARRRNLPSVPISTELQPAAAVQSVGDDETIEEFRRLVKEHLGEMALAILDARLEGRETKSLTGVGSSYRIKLAVQELKNLAREFSKSVDDPAFRWKLRNLLQAEEKTLAKRFQKVTENTEVLSPAEKITTALQSGGMTIDSLLDVTGLPAEVVLAVIKWMHRVGRARRLAVNGEAGVALA